MSKAIGDESAMRFSPAFYQALGYGRNLRDAFELGCSQIELDTLIFDQIEVDPIQNRHNTFK